MHSISSESSRRRQQAAMMAKRLFDFYPAQEAGNPETVLAGVVELFEHYPPELAARAVSPVFGLPSKHKFMPRIAEIKEYLDAQLPRPRPEYLPRLSEPDRQQRPSYAELQERCARDGLIIGKRGRKNSVEKEISEFREKFGISQQAWNSIPDAK